MNSLKKTALWLIKTSCYLSVVAFAVIYICSFMWLKMGMGYTQTIFNHAVIEANANLTQPNVRIGDLIIAKEYLYSRTPDIHDIVVYPYNDKIYISIVEKINEEDDNVFSFKVTPNNEEPSILLYKEDIIGELYIIAEGLGKIGMFIISPMFVILLYCLIGFAIIIFKTKNKSRKSKVSAVKKTNSNMERKRVNLDSVEKTNDNLCEDKSLVSYFDKSDDKSLNKIKTTAVSNHLDNTISPKDIIYSKEKIKTNKKKRRISLSKKKLKKNHFNKYNTKKKISKKRNKKKKYNHKKKIKK